MTRKRLLVGMTIALLVACGKAPPAPVAAPAPGSPQELGRLVERYFEDFLTLNPVAATFFGDHRYDDRLTVPDAAYVTASRALHQHALDGLHRIDRASLNGDAVISYDVFDYGQRISLENYGFPGRLMPFNQMRSPANFFAQMGSGRGVQPFETVKDYDNFAARMAAFPALADTFIAAMREGIADGIVQPRVIMERVVPQLDALAAGPAESTIFWQPVATMPAAIAAADRERLAARYRELIDAGVLPSYARLRDFVRDDYLPKARDSIGLSALPDGGKWYAFLARAYTTTDTPVEQLHQIGLDEVARIESEIAGTIDRVGFKGSATALAESMRRDVRFQYRRPEDLLDACRDLKARVDAGIPRLFSLLPKAKLEIRRFEAFREREQAAAEYRGPPPDGSRPGVFYVNTWDLPSRPSYQLETLFLHEAIPGHHFQIALAVENLDLPRFRRLDTDDALGYTPDISTAYSEGWGFYAESLGDELGMFTDPYQKLGNLFAESWRAARLVVDTGIHAKGWTRQQAIDYVLAHTALSVTDATAEVERYIAMPGQALAYKTGQMTIRRLRTRAEKELGPRFDVRAFHAQVLDSGSLPLPVLEAKIHRWIESKR